MDDHLFLRARDKFLDSLPPKERARLPSCNSAQKLLAALAEMKPNQQAVTRNTKKSLVSHVSSLVDVMRPYFDCVNLIVAANSDVASPVWGAVRLVLEKCQ
ncbi:hypothetical protein BJ170DRAFT_608135 [Xylariales sp. AK1849]|nr:hypothetical protein BJ170DRAFT_608135 [Xylariales sp. AK1849]